MIILYIIIGMAVVTALPRIIHPGNVSAGAEEDGTGAFDW